MHNSLDYSSYPTAVIVSYEGVVHLNAGPSTETGLTHYEDMYMFHGIPVPPLIETLKHRNYVPIVSRIRHE